MKKGWPHKNLVAWQESMDLVKMIYEFASKLPSDERFNIISQLKRAGTSIPLNIAEGAARNSDKEFRQFLHVSLGSLSEVNTLLDLCVRLGFAEEAGLVALHEREQKCAALINGLIKSLNSRIQS